MVIAADGTAHKKSVTLGLQNPEDVQILTGLTPPTSSSPPGAYGLDDGTKVKIGRPNAKLMTTKATLRDKPAAGKPAPGRSDDK